MHVYCIQLIHVFGKNSNLDAALEVFNFLANKMVPTPTVVKAILVECIRFVYMLTNTLSYLFIPFYYYFYFYSCDQHKRALAIWQYICNYNVAVDPSYLGYLCSIAEATSGMHLVFK